MSSHLLQSLSALIPNADLSIASRRPWCSLGFGGMQTSIRVILSSKDHAVIAARFASQLAEQDFDASQYLVADIAVTAQVSGENQTRLVIDALLLDGD